MWHNTNNTWHKLNIRDTVPITREHVTQYQIYVTQYQIYVTQYQIYVTHYKINVTQYQIYVTQYQIYVTQYQIYVTQYPIYVRIKGQFFFRQIFTVFFNNHDLCHNPATIKRNVVDFKFQKNTNSRRSVW